MFTGIVERTARVVEVLDRAGGRRLGLAVEPDATLPPWQPVALGESIAVNGVCLTAVAAHPLAFDVVPETLSRTTLGALRGGDAVNLERSLAVGDRFGGHYVTGHVDGLGKVLERRVMGDQTLFRIEAPPALARQMIPKGSIAVDGISLTLIEVDRTSSSFTFAAIPHTLARTTLGARATGAAVNLETDAFGKWVLHGLDQLALGAHGKQPLEELLERAGMKR